MTGENVMPQQYTISVQYWLDRQWRSTNICDIANEVQATFAFKHWVQDDGWQLLAWGKTPLGYPEAVFHKIDEQGSIELYRVMMLPMTSVHDIIEEYTAKKALGKGNHADTQIDK